MPRNPMIAVGKPNGELVKLQLSPDWTSTRKRLTVDSPVGGVPYDVGAVSEGQAVGRLLRDIDTNDPHPDEPDDRWSRQPVGALPRSRRVGDQGAVPTERANAVSFAGSGNEPVRWVTSTSGRGR